MTMTHDTARFWDRTARRYAASPISDMAGYERTLARIGEILSPDAHVLELGCGTGTTALRLAPRIGRIVASDVSAGMIAIAKEKAAANGAANVTFAVSAAGAVEAEPNAYDAVLALNLLHLVGERPALFRRVYRFLKPGGVFISKTPCLSEMNPFIRLAVPAMRVLGLAPEVAFFTGRDLERQLVAAGFVIEERARHGSGRKDPRVFLVARKPGSVQ